LRLVLIDVFVELTCVISDYDWDPPFTRMETVFFSSHIKSCQKFQNLKICALLL